MTEQKSLFAAIVGRPNAGKSSFMNRILGQKVVIVSDKPQTTRTKVMGVLTQGEKQYVFIDTPGFHKPRNSLGENMIKAIGNGMDDVDVCLLTVDCTEKISPMETELIKKISAKKLKCILLINKVDLITEKEKLLSVIMEYNKLYDFSAVIPISAKTGDGFDAVLEELEPFLISGPHMFEDDTLTDQPERLIAAELLREKFLYLLENEIPHGIAVVIERFHFREEDEILDMDAEIYCEKESHKSIIIGKNGGLIKKAASMARRDMEGFFGCKVNLKCWVKVKEGWRNRMGTIHNFGLDSNQ